MAAGLGFKTFTTGEVLTAADTNGYLMQGVLVFATAAARNAAITSPQEGQFAFTKDTNGLWYYDGAAWVASGATGDIEGVTAGTGISGGGTSGTVTVTNSMATAIDAKGDLVVGTGADAFSRLAVGTNTYLLTADSAEATGLKWAAPAASSSGLTLIVKSSFSAITSHSLNNCFSATYDCYKVIVTFTASTGTGIEISYKLRSSGTDNSADYAGTHLYAFGTTVGAQANGALGTDEFFAGSSGAATAQYTSIVSDINTPFQSQPTTFLSRSSYGTALVFNNNSVGYHNNGSSFDGLTLIGSSGTLTGTIYVYGMAI